MHAHIIDFESSIKSLIWNLIQIRFKSLTVYTAIHEFLGRGKKEYAYAIKDKKYQGCETLLGESDQQVNIIFCMLMEMLCQLGFENQHDEMVKFLTEHSKDGKLVLEFNDKWKAPKQPPPSLMNVRTKFEKLTYMR